MDRKIKILHIDQDYRGNLVTIQGGKLIQFPLSLEMTLETVRKEQFDLIVSDPHHLAILPPDQVRLRPLD